MTDSENDVRLIEEAYNNLVKDLFKNFHIDHDVNRFKSNIARAKQSRALAITHLKG